MEKEENIEKLFKVVNELNDFVVDDELKVLIDEYVDNELDEQMLCEVRGGNSKYDEFYYYAKMKGINIR